MREIIVRYNDGNDHMAVRGGEYIQDLVRCKDCEYGEYREDFDDYLCRDDGICVHDADFFCADGEERDERDR